ncbi:uncharacterized protein LOC106638931 isoform X2 [Copidosoma floridanum]|uniref:uncharacterized protein LOC106638931 isoform X2 n=1 Tax=Copidosoma floridanum TaxID=29053 RepID=UPI0006C9CEF2|nr:uncharacterized protein LOC106638931 isoform X2 [Copidosoma floridanum]
MTSSQPDAISEGWFSVISGNGTAAGARVYRRVETLVRAGVPAFLLAAPLRAYSLTHSKMENGNLRAHYTKTTIRAGEVLRLLAVFQDMRRGSSVAFNITGGFSERDQYAQCLDAHGREVFAPLSARGEFYAVCLGDGSAGGNLDTSSDALLYKVHQLARRQLPLRVRLIAGPLPVPLPREYGGLMQLELSTRGPIVLGCLVPETPVYNPEMLELLVAGSGAPRVRRARLGYPSEARLLASPKMQRLLTACSRAMGDRATEPRVAPQKLHSEDENLKEMHLKKIKPKPESKPILQSLREGLEQLKKPGPPTAAVSRPDSEARPRSASAGPGPTPGAGILERINKLRKAGRSRNPAKKSASFTFAVRPEIAMKTAQAQKYSSLEPSEPLQHPKQPTPGKSPVQRSVSTSVLEVPSVELQPNYSRVRDSLAGAPQPTLAPPDHESLERRHTGDDIYAEICESPAVVDRQCPGSHVMARVKILVRDEQPREQQSLELQPAVDRIKIFVRSSPESPADRNDASVHQNDSEAIYNTVF